MDASQTTLEAVLKTFPKAKHNQIYTAWLIAAAKILHANPIFGVNARELLQQAVEVEIEKIFGEADGATDNSDRHQPLFTQEGEFTKLGLRILLCAHKEIRKERRQRKSEIPYQEEVPISGMPDPVAAMQQAADALKTERELSEERAAAEEHAAKKLMPYFDKKQKLVQRLIASGYHRRDGRDKVLPILNALETAPFDFIRPDDPSKGTEVYVIYKRLAPYLGINGNTCELRLRRFDRILRRSGMTLQELLRDLLDRAAIAYRANEA